MQTKQRVKPQPKQAEHGKKFHQLKTCPACHEQGTLQKDGLTVRCVQCGRSWSNRAIKMIAAKYKSR